MHSASTLSRQFFVKGLLVNDLIDSSTIFASANLFDDLKPIWVFVSITLKNEKTLYMKRFAKRICIDNREFQFSFSEVLRPNCSKYYVSVTEEGSNVTAFEMKQAGFRGDWTVCQPAPEWVVQTEPTLAQFINEYLN